MEINCRCIWRAFAHCTAAAVLLTGGAAFIPSVQLMPNSQGFFTSPQTTRSVVRWHRSAQYMHPSEERFSEFAAPLMTLQPADSERDSTTSATPSRSGTTIPSTVVNVGNPQVKVETTKMNIDNIMAELAEIQDMNKPKDICILGTRHCGMAHQQIVELLSFALVLSGNHVYTSGATGTNAAAIKGAQRAGRSDLLTVILPQSLHLQPAATQPMLKSVKQLVSTPRNDDLPLHVASKMCNSALLEKADHLIAFVFHNSKTILETCAEARAKEIKTTCLFFD